MTRDCTRTLLWAGLVTVLGSCAMPGNSAHPGPVAEPGYRESGPRRELQIDEPQTIAAWEARIHSHAATLHAMLPVTGGGAATGGTTTTGPTTAPPTTPPTTARTRPRHPRTGPTPGRAPGRAAVRPPTRTTKVARRSIRCRRICRHVRAICYAARRICQIAARIGGENARAACQRNQKRCRSARNVTKGRGCTGCGQAKRSRKNKSRRRACLNKKTNQPPPRPAI